MEMLEEQRETWPTRGGFVLAAVGSAVGLGNLWGFPYMLYDNGGAAFDGEHKVQKLLAEIFAVNPDKDKTRIEKGE